MKGQRGIHTYSKLHNMFTMSTLLFGETKYTTLSFSAFPSLSPSLQPLSHMTVRHMMNVWCVCCPCYQWQRIERFLTPYK